jgi:hypothetical protein
MVCSGNTCVVTAKAPSLTSRPDGLAAVAAHGDFFRRTAQLDRSGRDLRAGRRAAGGTAPPGKDDLSVPFMRVTRLLEVLRAPTDPGPNRDDRRESLPGAESLG